MRTKKSLGQNFLRDTEVIRRIGDALELTDEDTVLEIGPGRGALTDMILSSGTNVVAVEIDSDLAAILQTQFRFAPNFRIIAADFLATELADILAGADPAKTKLVGNLPYYISTAILQKLAHERLLFSEIVLMLQREVVDRITAKPGNSERGFLTVLTEAAFEIERLFDVSPEAFIPQPKVWSSVVALRPKPNSIGDETPFRELISTAFSQKRKTILNNLKHLRADAASVLADAAIDPRRRAETLTLEEWFGIYSLFTTKIAGRPFGHPAK